MRAALGAGAYALQLLRHLPEPVEVSLVTGQAAPSRLVDDARRIREVVVVPPGGDGRTHPDVLRDALTRLGPDVVHVSVGGVAEAVGDGPEVVPPENPRLLAAAMGELIADAATCSRLAEAGRRRAWRAFDVTRTAGQSAQVYGAAREGHPTPCRNRKEARL